MLDLNLSVSRDILDSAQLFAAIKFNGGGYNESKKTKSSIVRLSSQLRLWKQRADDLLRKLDGTSVLVSLHCFLQVLVQS
jgi:hypothetical protein